MILFTLGLVTQVTLVGMIKKHLLFCLSISCRLVLKMNEVIRLERERFERQHAQIFLFELQVAPHKQHNLKYKIAWLT